MGATNIDFRLIADNSILYLFLMNCRRFIYDHDRTEDVARYSKRCFAVRTKFTKY